MNAWVLVFLVSPVLALPDQKDNSLVVAQVASTPTNQGMVSTPITAQPQTVSQEVGQAAPQLATEQRPPSTDSKPQQQAVKAPQLATGQRPPSTDSKPQQQTATAPQLATGQRPPSTDSKPQQQAVKAPQLATEQRPPSTDSKPQQQAATAPQLATGQSPQHDSKPQQQAERAPQLAETAPKVEASSSKSQIDALQSAKDNLAMKIQQVLLGTAVTQTMLVNWYTDPTCSGVVQANGVITATEQCQFLPGYPISGVVSATAECSNDNTRGTITFYDTSCINQASGNTGRQAQVTTSANCVQFPGQSYYAKIEWCQSANAATSSWLSLWSIGLMFATLALMRV